MPASSETAANVDRVLLPPFLPLAVSPFARGIFSSCSPALSRHGSCYRTPGCKIQQQQRREEGNVADTYQQLEERARQSAYRAARAEHILSHWMRAIEDADPAWLGNPKIRAAALATRAHFDKFGES